MNKLPRDLSGQQVIKALREIGFYVKRQKGSHIVVRRDSPYAQVVVPDHRIIDTGTLGAVIEGAGLSVKDFLDLIN